MSTLSVSAELHQEQHGQGQGQEQGGDGDHAQQPISATEESSNSVLDASITAAAAAAQPVRPSPRTGATSAPISHERAVARAFLRSTTSARSVHGARSGTLSSSLNDAALSPLQPRQAHHHQLIEQQGGTDQQQASSLPESPSSLLLSLKPRPRNGNTASSPLLRPRRLRTALGRATSLGSASLNRAAMLSFSPPSNLPTPSTTTSSSPNHHSNHLHLHHLHKNKKWTNLVLSQTAADAQTQSALTVNDSMVYLDGPAVYACQHCRTHLSSHDFVISKSFHGRHGRAYLLDQAVNVRVGPPEDRMLMTGLHAVCDIFCKRCQSLIGWTYQKAYEASQKYKEGKFIIEKINLYLEESDAFTIPPPAGERRDTWRQRSLQWGNEYEHYSRRSGGEYSHGRRHHCRRDSEDDDDNNLPSVADMVYEYLPPSVQPCGGDKSNA